MVLARPRFKRMGLWRRPSCFNSSKFCMFRAPTWMMSTSSNRGRCSMLMISVTMGRPVFCLASLRSSRPSAFMPWKA